MKVTYNWLKEYVDFDLSEDQLADMLTMLGLEVEGMERLGGGMDDVVVARVEEKRQHPNADKLSLCKVSNGREILDVVCGAQNFKSGDTVALAQIGAVLPGDFKIKRSKIRGEESCGMLCSEKELGLAEESSGIMILPEGLELGSLCFSLGLKDTAFEIGLTPNRADCLSVSALPARLLQKAAPPQISETSLTESGPTVEGMIAVSVEDAELCRAMLPDISPAAGLRRLRIGWLKS
jgi:phenylalanyl-tRNA synthetase beta chain